MLDMNRVERPAENRYSHLFLLAVCFLIYILFTLYNIFFFFSSLKRRKSVKNQNMKKSAFISDIIFTFFTTTIFTLCLFRFLSLGMFPAFLLSILCGILASLGIGAWLQSRRKEYFLKKSDEIQKQKLLLHLALLSDEQKTRYFQTVLSQTSPTQRLGKLRLSTDDNLYVLKFRFSPVTADEVATLSRLKTTKQRVLLCSEIEDAAARLCARLNVTVRTGEHVYNTIKTAQLLPQDYLGEEQPQNKRARRLRLCFAKSNAKRFLVGGLLVLLTSLITPFPYYYLITGTALVCTAIFIRVFGYS